MITHHAIRPNEAWCGLTLGEHEDQRPWPITCKRCCAAIRKGRKRHIFLLSHHPKTEELALERGRLDTAFWPTPLPPNPERVVPDGKPFLVTGPKPKGKRPKLLRSSKKATAFVAKAIAGLKVTEENSKILFGPDSYTRHYSEQEIQEILFLLRLWLTEKDEAAMQKVQGLYPKILFGKIQTYVPPPPKVVRPKKPGTKKLQGPR
jgi:hypothetical protein